MKRKIIKWGSVAILCFLVGGVLWDGVVGYTPSKDGKWEEKVALEDMNDKCDTLKIDCSGIQVTERLPPREVESCEFSGDVKPNCKKTKGFWEFVVRLKTGEEYLIAVLPFGSTPVLVGPHSEIQHLEDQKPWF